MNLMVRLTFCAMLFCLASDVQADIFRGKLKPAGCCETANCAPCSYACCPEVKTEKVKKHYWETECKPVCIPKVHCPLLDFFRKDKKDPCTSQDACGRPLNSLCAEVRMVKKLKKVEYECEKCVVEWNVRCVSTGCAKACDSYGNPAGCCQTK